MTISDFFIEYTNNSKEYRFYCPNYSPKIMKYKNTRFLEDIEPNGNVNYQ